MITYLVMHRGWSTVAVDVVGVADAPMGTRCDGSIKSVVLHWCLLGSGDNITTLSSDHNCFDLYVLHCPRSTDDGAATLTGSTCAFVALSSFQRLRGTHLALWPESIVATTTVDHCFVQVANFALNCTSVVTAGNVWTDGSCQMEHDSSQRCKSTVSPLSVD